MWRPRLEEIACRFGVPGAAARGLRRPVDVAENVSQKKCFEYSVLIRHERAFSRYSPSSPSTARGPHADSADTGPVAPPHHPPAHVTARRRKLPSCTAVMNAAMRRNARSGGSFGRAWWQHFRRESMRSAYKCCGATRRAARCALRVASKSLRVASQSLRAPVLRRAGTHGTSWYYTGWRTKDAKSG